MAMSGYLMSNLLVERLWIGDPQFLKGGLILSL